MDLGECAEKIREVAPDRERAKSLRALSDAKEGVVADAALMPENVAVYVALMYDALHEALSAHLSMQGYKVTTHICLGILLEQLDPCFPRERFERYRKARNRINYYGKRLSLERGKAFIAGMRELKASLPSPI